MTHGNYTKIVLAPMLQPMMCVRDTVALSMKPKAITRIRSHDIDEATRR